MQELIVDGIVRRIRIPRRMAVVVMIVILGMASSAGVEAGERSDRLRGRIQPAPVAATSSPDTTVNSQVTDSVTEQNVKVCC